MLSTPPLSLLLLGPVAFECFAATNLALSTPPPYSNTCSDAAAWPVQGLIRHFRPELERRMAEYDSKQKQEATA